VPLKIARLFHLRALVVKLDSCEQRLVHSISLAQQFRQPGFHGIVLFVLAVRPQNALQAVSRTLVAGIATRRFL